MAQAHASEGHHAHISPLGVYLGVYGALLVLTVLTVVVSYMGLPPTTSIITAMVVALVKASLVCAWFMHLKYDTKFNVIVFLSAVWFAGLFFIFTSFDIQSRGMVLDIEQYGRVRQHNEAASAANAKEERSEAGEAAAAPAAEH